MADLGGIPGQVFSELKGVVTDASKGVASAGKDIAKGTAETLIKAATPAGVTTGQGEGKSAEAGQAGADPMATLKTKNEQKRKQGLERVRAELQEYYEQQKKAKKHEEVMVEEQRKMEEMQRKESKKKQEEKEVLGRLSRQYGGTGEVGKSSY